MATAFLQNVLMLVIFLGLLIFSFFSLWENCCSFYWLQAG
jgi:hypothetical protein